MIDSEESPEVAVRREIQEEAGYHGPLNLTPSYIFKSGDGTFEYYNFLASVHEEFKPKLDWENSDAKWMTLDEVLNLSNKHFGLSALLKNDMRTIKRILQGY
jgi:8-oxo-dGTP pyrophosphatase MutT (NUDIX family)